MRFIHQNDVLESVKEYPNCTASELFKILFKDVNDISDVEKKNSLKSIQRCLRRLWETGFVEPSDEISNVKRWVVCEGTPKNPRNKVKKTTWRMIEYNGESKCIKHWCDELGLNYGTVKVRLSKGWSVEEAFEHPVRMPR